jgi:hypothetical protein
MRWPERRTLPESRSKAVRSDAFSCAKGVAGAVLTAGAPAMMLTSSQKNNGRHALRRATNRRDDRLCR